MHKELHETLEMLAAKKPGYFQERFKETVKEKTENKKAVITKWQDTAEKIVDGILKRLFHEALDKAEDKITENMDSINVTLPIPTNETFWEYLNKSISKSKYAEMLDALKENNTEFNELLKKPLEETFAANGEKIIGDEGFTVMYHPNKDNFWESKFQIFWPEEEKEDTGEVIDVDIIETIIQRISSLGSVRELSSPWKKRLHTLLAANELVKNKCVLMGVFRVDDDDKKLQEEIIKKLNLLNNSRSFSNLALKYKNIFYTEEGKINPDEWLQYWFDKGEGEFYFYSPISVKQILASTAKFNRSHFDKILEEYKEKYLKD